MTSTSFAGVVPNQNTLSHAFHIKVNGREFEIADPVPTGRQLLSAAGFAPADEHVLIEILRPGTRSIGLDESTDLHGGGREAFRAFKSDQLYLFTVDGNGYEWGEPSISESELRSLAYVPADELLVLERVDEEDRIVEAGSQLALNESGTEHLRKLKKLVRVLLDEIEKDIPRGSYTTEELITVLGVAPGYLLNVLDAHGKLQPLEPKQSLRVKDGMRFYSQAPGGGAS